MLFAIRAYDGVFEGLHGMEARAVVEVIEEEEVREIGYEMSRQVIEDYQDIYNTFIEEAEFNGIDEESDEWYEYIEEQIENDICYDYWRVKENSKSLEDLNEMFYNDPEGFIDEYCEED